jgi:branched-chain amino acid aminotransferase
VIPIFNEEQISSALSKQENPYFKDYFAFYSSWLGGITKDPRMMMLPIDDHMVHRGDGIFEAMKAEGRGVYLMDEHLERMSHSSGKISLQFPFPLPTLKNIICETLRAADQENASVRVFLSRGPGNFSVNPYDAIQSQCYVVIHRLCPPTADKYEKGVFIGKSDIPVKPSWMAQVKSCNYLPNVLMKKEAVDRKLDFVIGIDSEGNITESATENIMIVDQSGAIIHPNFDFILRGTTMIRTCELARDNGFTVSAKPITIDDLLKAQEVMITGTSLNVLPVVKYENNLIANGNPGPITKKLNELIRRDIQSGPKRTPY